MRFSVYLHPLYWGLRLLSLLPAFLLEALAQVLLFFSLVFGGRNKRITAINIKLCYPNLSAQEQQTLVKQSLLQTLRTALEMPKVLFQSTEKNLSRLSSITGAELIEQYQAAGNGVIVIAPHFGNWEYIGPYLGKHYQSIILFKPSELEVVNDIIRYGRGRSGVRIVPTDKKGVMAVLKYLKQGGVTGILPDQVPDDKASWMMAPFMGHAAPTMTLIANLTNKPNIKAVMGAAKRLDDGSFALSFSQVDDALYSKDALASATALNKAIETLIAEAPDQYQWEYKRFKFDEHGRKNKVYKK
jgi:KDO2-lipid IV(A) lauroyltransferase